MNSGINVGLNFLTPSVSLKPKKKAKDAQLAKKGRLNPEKRRKKAALNRLKVEGEGTPHNPSRTELLAKLHAKLDYFSKEKIAERQSARDKIVAEERKAAGLSNTERTKGDFVSPTFGNDSRRTRYFKALEEGTTKSQLKKQRKLERAETRVEAMEFPKTSATAPAVKKEDLSFSTLEKTKEISLNTNKRDKKKSNPMDEMVQKKIKKDACKSLGKTAKTGTSKAKKGQTSK